MVVDLGTKLPREPAAVAIRWAETAIHRSTDARRGWRRIPGMSVQPDTVAVLTREGGRPERWAETRRQRRIEVPLPHHLLPYPEPPVVPPAALLLIRTGGWADGRMGGRADGRTVGSSESALPGTEREAGGRKARARRMDLTGCPPGRIVPSTDRLIRRLPCAGYPKPPSGPILCPR